MDYNTLIVEKNEAIAGGILHWKYNINTEIMSWWGFISIKILWLTKKYDFEWCHRVGKSLMTPDNYKVGMNIHIDENTKLSCIGIHGNKISNDKEIDLKIGLDNEYSYFIVKLLIVDHNIDIIRIDGNLKYNGIAVKLNAKKE
jgi:hypothetical protein